MLSAGHSATRRYNKAPLFRVAGKECVYHLKFAWPQIYFAQNSGPPEIANNLHLTLIYLNSVDTLIPASLRPILILSFPLHLGFVRGVFHSGVPANILR
jgi:hypothetical protein